GSQGTLYSDSTCTIPLIANNIQLPITSGASNFSIPLYFMDKKAETLNLGIADPNGVMNPTSGLQSVQVLPSNINLTGPTTVVAGKCSTAFTITLQDALGNNVAASANTTLSINGLSGTTTGFFYTNANCTGTGTNTSVVVPKNSSQIQVFFSDT